MYIVYQGKYKITSNPISLNWLYNVLKSVYVPWHTIAQMLPTECIAVEGYKIVKVD
jgi:hypothetical protein